MRLQFDRVGNVKLVDKWVDGEVTFVERLSKLNPEKGLLKYFLDNYSTSIVAISNSRSHIQDLHECFLPYISDDVRVEYFDYKSYGILDFTTTSTNETDTMKWFKGLASFPYNWS